MKKYALGEVCSHGSLARKCEICDLFEELGIAKEKLKKCKLDFQAIKGYVYEGQTEDKFLDGMNQRQKTINELCDVALRDLEEI